MSSSISSPDQALTLVPFSSLVNPEMDSVQISRKSLYFYRTKKNIVEYVIGAVESKSEEDTSCVWARWPMALLTTSAKNFQAGPVKNGEALHRGNTSKRIQTW